MKIQVTQDHIDRGQPVWPCKCPVALAMKDAGLEDPSVGARRLSWGVGGHCRSISQPENVHDFIHRFDAGEPVEPFEFELVVP